MKTTPAIKVERTCQYVIKRAIGEHPAVLCGEPLTGRGRHKYCLPHGVEAAANLRIAKTKEYVHRHRRKQKSADQRFEELLNLTEV